MSTDGAETPPPARTEPASATEAVADRRRLAVQLADHGLAVVGDPADRLASEYLRVGLGLADGVGGRPASRAPRAVLGGLDQLGPAVPAPGQQPQPVHEHDGCLPDVLARSTCLSSSLVTVRSSISGVGFSAIGPPNLGQYASWPNMALLYWEQMGPQHRVQHNLWCGQKAWWCSFHPVPGTSQVLPDGLCRPRCLNATVPVWFVSA